jgi:hypothetical protein
VQTIYQLGTGPHGGGYDDIDFNNNSVYLSASAPTINPNTAPAIVTLTLFGPKAILTSVLNGAASAINVTTGKPEILNLQDPDSMIVDPLGELVMTSQGDGELIIVQYPGLSCQNAFVVPLTSEAGGSTIGNHATPVLCRERLFGSKCVRHAYRAQSDSFIRWTNQPGYWVRDTNCEWDVQSWRYGFHPLGSGSDKIHQCIDPDPRNLSRGVQPLFPSRSALRPSILS